MQQPQDSQLPAKKVLIIEDVASMRELLSLLISEIDGFQVSDAVENLAEARRALDRRRPDVVLLDLVLPGPGGRELIPELESRGIPYLVLVSSIPEGLPRSAPTQKALDPVILVKPSGSRPAEMDAARANIQHALVKALDQD